MLFKDPCHTIDGNLLKIVSFSDIYNISERMQRLDMSKTLSLIGTHWAYWVATPAHSGQQTVRWSQGAWRPQDLAGVGWSQESQDPGPLGPAPLSTPFSEEGRMVAGTTCRQSPLPACHLCAPASAEGANVAAQSSSSGSGCSRRGASLWLEHSPATRLSWELCPRSFHQKGMLFKAGTIDRCNCTCMTPSR